MTPWLRVLVLFVAIVAAAFFLRVLPPLVVLVLFVGGVAYANYLLTLKPRTETARTTAQLLGLRADPGGIALSAFPFALLERGREHEVSDAMSGRWKGSEVRLFDLSYGLSIPIEGADARRSFTCLVAPAPVDAPHTVVEPRGFLTPDTERPSLPVVEVASEPFRAAFDVRSADAAFVDALFDPRLIEWFLGQEERWGVELRGSVLLWYTQRVPPKDRDLVLAGLTAFLERLPEGVREGYPAPTAGAIPNPPVDLEPDD